MKLVELCESILRALYAWKTRSGRESHHAPDWFMGTRSPQAEVGTTSCKNRCTTELQAQRRHGTGSAT